MYFYLIAASVAIIDQFIKFAVAKWMLIGQSIKLIPGIFSLTYVRNAGAAFSLFVGFSPYLAVISILVILGVIYFHHRLPPKEYLTRIGLALVLGGSLGNLIDRLLRGSVIDYLDFYFWPVFNFADMMINLGVLLIVIRLLGTRKKDF